ncbi:DNA adenine methylase [Cellulosilyticum sp. ST5]|uniref:DNA adenine methylase n=1 Tax=unclassified Cellulosilyticum TaxID=2643091 RepID=UPI000F8E57E6|nr:DNA adenine methylase [Cellulosilyticum sp. WCF-2]QEH67278.1 DNA adenine methylase [Cellulosilyticum sp. WCF-2]
MLKPPISRMGGKSKLRKTIIERIPEHTCYLEPFFGAGWVFFGKEPSKVEVINDVDKELINMFKMIKYHAPEIERMLEYEFSGRDMFEEYKHCTVEYLTEIQRAVRFLYLISQSFASRGVTYGYGTNTKPSPQIFYKGVLGDIKERLRNTYVENKSFNDIIHRYDRSHSFFFCDPPYYETAGYGNTFGHDEHLVLRDTLSSINGKFLVTINDHPEVREWYKGFNIEEVKVSYSVSKEKSARKEYNELIITNY